MARFSSSRAVLAAILIVYVLLAGMLARVQSPYCDEAYLASPAFNLIHHGYMGTSILDETSTWHRGMSLRGINRYTYQVMPLHFLTQAAWYTLTGFGLLQMRWLSILWGLVALISFYLLVRALMGSERAALWVVALVAVDAVFLDAASFGRADMAAAALGFAGLATYMRLEKSRLTLAVLGANCLVAGAVFTHPAAMPAFAGLIFLALFYSFPRIRFYHLPLAALPYLGIAAGWGIYILRAPALFREQFGSNAAGRFSGLLKPWTLLARELGVRYLPAFGYGPNVSPVARLKLLILTAYVVSILACLLTPALRKQKGCQALLILAGIYVSIMTVLEGTKQTFYLVEIIPLYTAILGVWCWWCWESRTVPRALLGLAIGGLVALQLSRTYHVCRMDTFHSQYLPAVRFLQQESAGSGLIMGPATLAFSSGFDNPRLIDDLRLGYVTHKRPDAIVLDDRYHEWLGLIKESEPQVARYIDDLLGKQYRLAYDQSGYQIYLNKESVGSSQHSPPAAPD
jgi:hypothetical protein